MLGRPYQFLVWSEKRTELVYHKRTISISITGFRDDCKQKPTIIVAIFIITFIISLILIEFLIKQTSCY